jgi:hypothetical protein
MTNLTVEQRLDALTMRLLPALRADKYVDIQALDELCLLIEQQRGSGFFHDVISVRLAGKFWFVFCAMLTEAEHARTPGPILDAAWRYQEELRRSFGPTY